MKKPFPTIFFLLIITVLPGCVAYPRAEEKITMDHKGRSKCVTNIWCGSYLSFDLYQNTEMGKKQIVMLKAWVTGTESIGDGKSLFFDLDGEILVLEVGTDVTKFESTCIEDSLYNNYRGSGKIYFISEYILKQIAEADRVVAKVILGVSHKYVEGECISNTEMPEEYAEFSCRAGFKRFYEWSKIWN